MNTKVLEYIVAVAEEKSVTRAAEGFYLSQPSLSRHITNIESELGTKLFKRRGSELELTDAGKIYINGAQAILRLKTQAEEQLRKLRKAGSRRLRIVCEREFEQAVRQLSTTFHAQGGELPSIIVSTGEVAKPLQDGTADIAIGIFPEQVSEELRREDLHRGEFVLAVPANAKPENLCLLLHESDAGIRILEDRALAQWTVPPRWICRTDHATAQSMVLSGAGCAFFISEQIASEENILLIPQMDYVVSAIWRAEDARPQRCAFTDFLTAHFMC